MVKKWKIRYFLCGRLNCCDKRCVQFTIKRTFYFKFWLMIFGKMLFKKRKYVCANKAFKARKEGYSLDKPIILIFARSKKINTRKRKAWKFSCKKYHAKNKERIIRGNYSSVPFSYIFSSLLLRPLNGARIYLNWAPLLP